MTDAEIQRGMTAFLEEKGENALLEMPYVMPEEPVKLPGTGETVDTVLDMRFERDRRTRPKQAMFRWQLMTDGLVWRTRTDPPVWIFVKGGMASDEQVIRRATPDEIAHRMKLPRGWERVAQVDAVAEPVKREPGRRAIHKKRPKKKSLLKRFFGESLIEDQESYKLASTQCPLPEEVTNAILEYRGFITDEDLDDEDGYGDDPHVTVLYGLKDSDLPQVIDILGEMEPVEAQVSGAGLFENETQDVVILELESEGLHALHEALGQIPHETTHPDYKPHLTVAYVKKGLGEKYRDLNCEGLTGRTFLLDQVDFSATDGEVTPIPLGGDVMKSVVGAHSMTAGKSAVPSESVKEGNLVEAVVSGVYFHSRGDLRDLKDAVEIASGGGIAEVGQYTVHQGQRFWSVNGQLLSQRGLDGMIAAVEQEFGAVENLDEQEEPDPTRTGPGPIVYAREGKRGTVVVLDMKTREDAEKTRAELKKGQIGSVSLSGRERSQVMIQSLLSYEKLEPYILEALDEAGLSEQSPLFGVDVTEQYGMYCWDEIEEALDRYGLDSGKILGVLKRSIRPVRFTPYMDFSVGDIRDAIRNAGNTEGDAEDVTRMLQSIQTSVMTGVAEAAYRVTSQGKELRQAILDYTKEKGLKFDGEVLWAEGPEIVRLASRLRKIGREFSLKRIAEDVEDDVREALAPVLDRANRRLVSLRRSGDDFIGLLDSGRSIEIRKAGDLPVLGDFVILFGTEEYDPMSPTSVEELVRELQSPPVGEDTYTSDVAITDVIPITKGGKKVVKLPGLKRERIRRKTKRKYLRLGESVSRGESLISLVLRPDVIGVLDEKPVWGALHESGVIEAKPFKMGVEEFMEVRIDTSRKEWGEANVTALLDEVGSVDLGLQRQIQEQGDPGQVASDIENWVQTGIFEYAEAEMRSPSPGVKKLILSAKLKGTEPTTEWLAEQLFQDPEAVHELIMLRGPSDEVMEELKKSPTDVVAMAANLHFKEVGMTEGGVKTWLLDTATTIAKKLGREGDEAVDEIQRQMMGSKQELVGKSPDEIISILKLGGVEEAEAIPEDGYYAVRKPIPIWVRGPTHPTRSYFGSAQIQMPDWTEMEVPDTEIFLYVPGGTFIEIEGGVYSFSFLKPKDPFLKSYRTEFDKMEQYIRDGAIEYLGRGEDIVPQIDPRKAKPYTEGVEEQETTDPGANLGQMGMPGGNPMQATVGEQEPPDQMASTSSRTWTPGAMFKLHVLSPETGAGEWVYREVVGHEGEGDQSLIVYKTQEGRVMRLPHTQVDDAVGFGGAVGPERLGVKTGETPGDEEPVPPMGEVEEQAPSPEAQQLERDPRFAQALTKYQRSRDERDWEDVRKEATRVLRSEGPKVDRAVGQYAMTEEEVIMKPVNEAQVYVTDNGGAVEVTREEDAYIIGLYDGDGEPVPDLRLTHTEAITLSRLLRGGGGRRSRHMKPTSEQAEVSKKEMVDVILRAEQTIVGATSGDDKLKDELMSTWGERAAWEIRDEGPLSHDSGRQETWKDEQEFLMTEPGEAALRRSYEAAKRLLSPVGPTGRRVGEKDFKGKKKKVAGREVEEPTHLKSLAKKAGVSLDKALVAWGEAQRDFTKAHPEIKKGSDRYYAGVTGYWKSRFQLPTKKVS